MPLTVLHVTPQPAELLATEAVIEQDGQNSAIAPALERILGHRIE